MQPITRPASILFDPSWLCQSLLLFMSRRSILRPLPFRLAYPVTHKSELLSVSKGMQGEMKGRERENGIVFCAVRSILRHGDAPARRTCVCARIIGNGGVLEVSSIEDVTRVRWKSFSSL